MFLVNGIKAKLIQYDRSGIEYAYDDTDKREVNIKCCAYNVQRGTAFGIYTIPEASGYFQVPRKTEVIPGDQIYFNDERYPEYYGKTFTVLNIQYKWLFNRIENKVLAVK